MSFQLRAQLLQFLLDLTDGLGRFHRFFSLDLLCILSGDTDYGTEFEKDFDAEDSALGKSSSKVLA